MTRPVAVVFETQREFTALTGVIADLGARARTVQVQRADARRRTRGFFDGSRLVVPDVEVGLGDGMGDRLADILADLQLDAMLVFGDSDVAALAARVAASVGLPVGRVHDDRSPDERSSDQIANHQVLRVLTAVHFVSSDEHAHQLMADGVAPSRIVIVGNLAVETTLRSLPSAEEQAAILASARLTGDHVVAAINRAEHVDDPATLRFILKALAAQELTVAMPLNPHVARRIQEFGLVDEVRALTNLKLVDRSTFLTFVRSARLVVTDVGAVMREAATLRVPTLLLASHDPSPGSAEWISDARFARRAHAGAMLSAHLRTAIDDKTWAAHLEMLPNPVGDGQASRRVVMGLDRVTVRAARPSSVLLSAGSGP